MRDRLMVFSGSSNRPLAREICNCLDIRSGELAISRFSNENIFVQALESVRLYQDVQRGAARDRLIAGVTGRMRESLQVDSVLQSAVQEMRRALSLSEVEVRIGKAPMPGGEGQHVRGEAKGRVLSEANGRVQSEANGPAVTPADGDGNSAEG